MDNNKKGHVFWITGLAGAGKSTIGRLFVNRLKKTHEKVLLLDGDELRAVLGIEENYSYEERKKIAFTYCRLCKMLADQGFDIVIATVSMFHECHQWNREYQSHYYEIYLRVPKEVLIQRNQKDLFSKRSKNVVGIDIPFEEPQEPHLVLENHGELTPEQAEEQLYQFIFEKI